MPLSAFKISVFKRRAGGGIGAVQAFCSILFSAAPSQRSRYFPKANLFKE